MTHKEKAYLYWLITIDGIGPKAIGTLRKYVGSAEAVYGLNRHDLSWFLSPAQLDGLLKSRSHFDVEAEYAKLRKQGMAFYPYGDKSYPEKLIYIPDPPAAVFVRGTLPVATQAAVALIGTRKCSGYGSAMAKQLGRMLADAGVQVVSGMARGIDGIGQRAVCEAGGATFAVLGCGADVVYPQESEDLYHMIIARGGVISEYIPGTGPSSGHFPARNRIISGLSDVVVVVEAKEKSGTMITVDMALEQGRDVYALPGRLVDGLSAGCNRLIRQGAGLIYSLDEFVADIVEGHRQKIEAEMIALKKSTNLKTKQCKTQPAGNAPPMPQSAAPSAMSSAEKLIFSGLDYAPRSLEEIAALCPGLGREEVLRGLITFCLKGFASQMGAGNYCRNDTYY